MVRVQQMHLLPGFLLLPTGALYLTAVLFNYTLSCY